MKVADWGELEGDVPVFGGAVSNAHAMAAFLAWTEATGLGTAPVVSTGDHAAYCAEPARTVVLVRGRGTLSIAGNCEQNLGSGASDCGCGYGPGSSCDLASGIWFAHAAQDLGDDAKGWMRDLPDLAVFRAHGRRWGVVHGGATSVNRYLWPVSPEAAFAEEIAAFEAAAGPVDGMVAGHCGLPFRREVAGRLWVNTGALGMPPNDGDPRVSFGVIRRDDVELHRLGYDWEAARVAMRAAGLTQGYDACLATGRWPSEDILPRELRRAA